MVRTGRVETVLNILEHSHNKVLKTIVLFDDKSRGTVYVKPLHSSIVANEILASLIGKSLGIKIPEPCLVDLDPRLINEQSEQIQKCFGSIAIEGSGFEQFLIDDDAYCRFIADFDKSFDVAVFDEWIINDDRNSGNLIIDGKDIWFFDHDRCLPQDGEADRMARRNILFDIIQRAYTNKKMEQSISYYKEKLYNSIIMSAYRDHIDACKKTGIISNDEHNRLSLLLTNRIAYLSSFIDSRFCLDQRDLFGQGVF